MRFHEADGMHAGYLPGYPASHGCVRMPEQLAIAFFHAVDVGTPVTVFGRTPRTNQYSPYGPRTESKNAALVWPTSGSRISTTIRSALSRSLVALISIQPSRRRSSLQRARIVTESEKRRANFIWQLPSAALVSKPSRFLQIRTLLFRRADRTDSFRCEQIAHESSSERASPYRCPDASTLLCSETRPSLSSVRSQRYSVIGAGCFWSALKLNQIG